MSLGFPLGLWLPQVFTSEAALLGGGLSDGTLWILVDPAVGPYDAGIWPDTPRGGGGGGECALRDSTFILGELADFFYRQSIQAIPPSTATELIYQAPPWFIIDNPTPP